jgi:prephenate dehydrogenase
VGPPAGRENLAHLAELCGPGFRDTTRIASGSPDLWLDIVKSNQDVLANELRAFDRELARLTALVEKGDFEAVRRLLEAARERREGLLATSPPRRGRS